MDDKIDLNAKKKVEMELEKQKLLYIIDLIKRTVQHLMLKREKIVKDIYDYRKNKLEEYEDDEEKVELFDHDLYIKEESFTASNKKLKELSVLIDTPYFGRTDFRQEGEEGIESIYIGRFGLTVQDGGEPTAVIIDWRAPAAAAFYTGKLGDAKYLAPMGEVNIDVLLKRQFIIKNQKMLGMFDSSVDVKDEILQMVLSKNSSDKLKDVIMTIQKEQDDLIRQPKDGTIVINGVAGSGKTTIALHRTAYLLYNYRDSLEDKVMIFGPNNIFMEYISMVLPSLGESGVKQSTFTEFAMTILKLENIMSFKEYMEKILNGNKNFIEDILYKDSKEYIKKLDDFVNNVECTYFNFHDVFFRGKCVISASEIGEMYKNDYKYMPAFRRVKKLKRIIFSRIRDARDEEFRKIEKLYNDKASFLNHDQLELDKNQIDFERRIAIRELIKDVINAKKCITFLEAPSVIDLYKKFNGDKVLIYDDLAPILYIMIKLENIKLQNEIKYVVIDEAQDYSLLQFIVIREITKCRNMTIVGDSNQRIIPLKGELPMDKIEGDHFNLNKSYRSTFEIMEYANKYLSSKKIVPLVRNGKNPVEKYFHDKEDFAENLISDIDSLKEKGYENIAVITRDSDETYKVASEIKKGEESVSVIDDDNETYKSGVAVIPVYFAKGLEFDAVIVIRNAEESIKSEEDRRLMYVMCTRALHELEIFEY